MGKVVKSNHRIGLPPSTGGTGSSEKWRDSHQLFHCGFNDVYLMPYNHDVKPEIRSRLAFFSQDLMKAFQDSSSIKSISTQKGAIQY
jgi:hypothetical protein